MGRRKGSGGLTPLELEIMNVLWETGPANVQAVRARLGARRDLAYTTVQTMLNLLHRKGKAKRTLKDRTYYYRPAVTRRREVGHMVRDVVQRLFGGSAEELVQNLMETRQLTPEMLERLRAAVDDKGDE
jgi:BlaI family transcriptional regulator, penicillinase repressor